MEAVAGAARELDRLRRNWLAERDEAEGKPEGKPRTLTGLYNRRPTWLSGAHADLDRAVFACYGWPEDPEDFPEQELLERLLTLNLLRYQAEQGKP